MRRLTLRPSLLVTFLAASLIACTADAQQSAPAQPPQTQQQQGYSFMFGPMNGGPMMQGAIMFGPGMMGRGMMGQGGMGQGGMMGGMMMTPDPLRHLEGRIAFVKTELNITQAQTRPWNAFADAWRASAKTLSEAMQMPGQSGAAGTAGVMGGGMMSGAVMAGAAMSLPDQIAWAEKQMSAQLEALRAMKGPAAQLYAALSEEQKQVAAALMQNPMVMQGMMGRW